MQKASLLQGFSQQACALSVPAILATTSTQAGPACPNPDSDYFGDPD
jgi:hypothetical protein